MSLLLPHLALSNISQEEIAQARSKIEDLEAQNFSTKEEYESKVLELSDDNKRMSKELSELRERTNLSQQNWLKEKDDILEHESYLQSEFEQAKEAMHNWEVLAMEERSIRESLGEKVIDLEEQLATVKGAYEKTSSECESQAATVDGLQRSLQEIQAGKCPLSPRETASIVPTNLLQHASRSFVNSLKPLMLSSRN